MGRQDYFDVQAISNSSLSNLNIEQKGSPQKFYAYITNQLERKESLSLERGTLLHDWMEIPEQFIISDICKPSDMMVKLTEEKFKRDLQGHDYSIFELAQELKLYKNIKNPALIENKFNNEGGLDYYRFLSDSEGKIAVTEATKFILENCQSSILRNPLAVSLMFDFKPNQVVHKELEIYWEENEVKCKAKLDIAIIDDEWITIVDLKTTASSAYLFKDTFEFWHYYRQFEMYMRAIRHWMKENGLANRKIRCFNVVVETTGVFNCVVQKPTNYKTLAQKELDRLLDQVKWHQETGIWNMTREEMEQGHLIMNYDN